MKISLQLYQQIHFLDKRSAKTLSILMGWCNYDEVDFLLNEESINQLIKISEDYIHSSDSYIDITHVNEQGCLLYKDFIFPADVSMTDILEMYKIAIDFSNRRYKIMNVVKELVSAYDDGFYVLLDLRKIVKRRS